MKKFKCNLSVRPIPVVKDKNDKLIKDYTNKDWLAKLDEELNEVKEYAFALDDLESQLWIVKRGLAEELADVITVCTSYLEQLGYNEQRRSELFKQVNEKNRVRGYLKS